MKYHFVQIDHNTTSIARKVAGKRSTFMTYNCSQHNSFLLYWGKQAPDTQLQSSPSEGPPEDYDKHRF